MMKRLTKSLLGGVVVQILIVLGVVVAGKLLANSPEGPLRSLEEFTVVAFVFLSPGLMLLWPTATGQNPHPPFSGIRLPLGIIVNILVYSIIVYMAAALWRNLKTRRTKPT